MLVNKKQSLNPRLRPFKWDQACFPLLSNLYSFRLEDILPYVLKGDWFPSCSGPTAVSWIIFSSVLVKRSRNLCSSFLSRSEGLVFALSSREISSWQLKEPSIQQCKYVNGMVGSSVSRVIYVTLLSGKPTRPHAHVFSQEFSSVVSWALVGLFSFQSTCRKETQVKMKQWHVSAGPTQSRRSRTETSIIQSPLPKFGRK